MFKFYFSPLVFVITVGGNVFAAEGPGVSHSDASEIVRSMPKSASINSLSGFAAVAFFIKDCLCVQDWCKLQEFFAYNGVGSDESGRLSVQGLDVESLAGLESVLQQRTASYANHPCRCQAVAAYLEHIAHSGQ